MGKIVAIGGGEIGRPREGGGNYPVETTSIDKEIIALSGKTNPRLLFIPTASGDSEGYVEVVKTHFGKRLGCLVDVLRLVKNPPSFEHIKEQILSADIVYVGGGNTLKMMRIWRRLGVDQVLLEAYEKGIVLSGLSAGSICWFSFGNSDSLSFTSSSKDFIRVSGLGLIHALHCPHYDVEERRKEGLKNMMKKTSGVAIALENCAAIMFVDGEYRVCTSKSGATAYRTFWKQGVYYEEKIPVLKQFSSNSTLLTINPSNLVLQ